MLRLNFESGIPIGPLTKDLEEFLTHTQPGVVYASIVAACKVWKDAQISPDPTDSSSESEEEEED